MNGNTTKNEKGKNGESSEKKVATSEKSAATPVKERVAEKKPTKSSVEPVREQLSFYEEVYKQVETGTDGIAAVLPYVENKSMKNLFNGQRKSYETLAIELKTKITDMGGKTEKPNLFEKMVMKGGTMLNTITDQSESKLAELVLKGVNMGIISLTRLINQSGEKQVDLQFGNKLLSLYEKQMEALKTYL